MYPNHGILSCVYQLFVSSTYEYAVGDAVWARVSGDRLVAVLVWRAGWALVPTGVRVVGPQGAALTAVVIEVQAGQTDNGWNTVETRDTGPLERVNWAKLYYLLQPIRVVWCNFDATDRHVQKKIKANLYYEDV